MKLLQIGVMLFLSLSPLQLAAAAMDGEPLIFQLKTDEFETADQGSAALSWDLHAWMGSNLERFWFKSEGERRQGETEEFEMQALYSKAISVYWDLQAGLRHDAEAPLQKNWAVLGFQGLAPYFFEMETDFFLSEEGDVGLRVKAEYELLLGQRLILTPEIEMNFYAQDIPKISLGSGLANMNAGLRLRYEIRREFAPYIGINWQEKFGKTADFASLAAEEISETRFVVGVRFWF
jgi:copper resistance protein B